MELRPSSFAGGISEAKMQRLWRNALLTKRCSTLGRRICRRQHLLMHCCWTKIDSPRPFDTAEIRVDTHGVEYSRLAQCIKNAATFLRRNGINPVQAIGKPNFQPVVLKGPRLNDMNHDHILVQR